jgi:GntR family transcriptional regulator
MNVEMLVPGVSISPEAEGVLRRAEPDGEGVNLLRVLAESVLEPGPSEALRRLGADADEIARVARERAAAGEGSGRTTALLRSAAAEAEALLHPRVGPEHLVLALAKGRGAPSSVLREHAGGYTELVGELLVLAGATPPPFRVNPDPSSGVPMYEQIVAQVLEAVAGGRLERNDCLPPIRGLAAELGVAPGTVARAYGELEQMGVLQTEGARGTRVAASANEPRPDPRRRREEVERRVADAVVAGYRAGLPADELRGIFTRQVERYFGR